MQIGCGFDPKIYVEDPAYRELIRNHFDFIIPVWGMLPTNCFKAPELKVSSVVIKGIEAAREDGLDVHGHFIMSRISVPDWLDELAADGPNLTAGTDALKSVIDAQVKFWGDRVTDWIIANEMIGSDGLAKNHPWVRLIGDGLLTFAYTFAHQANPNARLWLKDYGLQNPKQWDSVYKQVSKLVDLNVPIHGVGAHIHTNLFPTRTRFRIANFAAHLYPYHGVRVNLLKYQIRRFRRLGLDFQASEVLVYPGNDSDKRRVAQGNLYQRYLAIAQAEQCSHFSFWCPVDDSRYPKVSWHWQGTQDYPGLWTWDGQAYRPKWTNIPTPEVI